MRQINKKADILRVIYFYYNDWVIREKGRPMKKAEKELISNMKMNELLNLCKAQDIPTDKSELKIHSIWKDVWI